MKIWIETFGSLIARQDAVVELEALTEQNSFDRKLIVKTGGQSYTFDNNSNVLRLISIENSSPGFLIAPEAPPECTATKNNTIYITRNDLRDNHIAYVVYRNSLERAVSLEEIWPHIITINDKPKPELFGPGRVSIGDKLVMQPSISGW